MARMGTKDIDGCDVWRRVPMDVILRFKVTDEQH